jgi:2,4-dienoyl-CoA reductase (NADPH2)
VFERALEAGTIGTLRLANRIVMGSMHLGIESDGEALAAFYSERARGGVGLIVTGGSCVNRAGAGGRNYSFINESTSHRPLRQAVDAVHSAGGRIALQLFHAGRYAYRASFGIVPVAPSSVPSRFSPDPPRAMTESDILETIADFAAGARHARAIGFDAVEVMASEGYLLNQFLSPVTNHRDDAWGGDFTRRMRFPREVLRAARAAAGDEFPIVFRISGADLMAGSTTQAETLTFARNLKDDGVDALNVGIGWHESAIPTVGQMVPAGVWIPFAAAIKRAVATLPVIASNRINGLAAADAVIAEGSADFVSMARPFLADSHLVAKSVRGAAASIDTCIACNQACIDRSLVDVPVSCMVNPRAARELEFPLAAVSQAQRRRFAVVGGGPAGLESARALAALGHGVVLFESHAELGGQFRMARRIPGKRDFGETIRYYTHELARLGVDVRCSARCSDAEALRGFDAAILAAGVVPRRVTLAGSGLPHVMSYADLLLGGARTGPRVAIVGAGGIGVDVAHFLSFGEANVSESSRFLYEQGLAAPEDGSLIVTGRKAVALMRRGRPIGQHIGKTTRWAVLAALRVGGVASFVNVEYDAIVAGGIRFRDAGGIERFVEADTVVIAAGQESNRSLLPGIERLGIPHRVVGGAREATELDAVRAFDDGLRAAYELGSR